MSLMWITASMSVYTLLLHYITGGNYTVVDLSYSVLASEILYFVVIFFTCLPTNSKKDMESSLH